MRKGSTLTEDQKQKISDGVRKAYVDGFSDTHRHHLSEAQKRRFARIAGSISESMISYNNRGSKLQEESKI